MKTATVRLDRDTQQSGGRTPDSLGSLRNVINLKDQCVILDVQQPACGARDNVEPGNTGGIEPRNDLRSQRRTESPHSDRDDGQHECIIRSASNSVHRAEGDGLYIGVAGANESTCEDGTVRHSIAHLRPGFLGTDRPRETRGQFRHTDTFTICDFEGKYEKYETSTI
jgi:hypothetical protein